MRRKLINSLTSDDSEIFLVTMVLARTDPKLFPSKDALEQRGVLSLTLRDSSGTINLTFWGSEEQVCHYSSTIELKSMVRVVNPMIRSINPERDTNFRPATSSDFQLTVNDQRGHIEVLADEEVEYSMIRSLSTPTKPITSAALSLEDIRISIGETEGETVDLLVAVRCLRPTREIIISRTGERKKSKEVIVIDQTLAAMSLQLWNDALIRLAERSWQACDTILFLVDVRIQFSAFYNRAVLGASSKTLVFTDPAGKEVDALRRFVKETPLSDNDLASSLSAASVDLGKITEVMTVQQIMNRAKCEDNEDQFTAVCYALITKLDLDGSASVYRRKCEKCKKLLRMNDTSCNDENCLLAECMISSSTFLSTAPEGKISEFFDIPVDISDASGTLSSCRLSGHFAETVLNCKLDDFLAMSSEERGRLKWRLLLERCVVKVVAKKRSLCRRRMIISVVDVQIPSAEEVAENLKIY